MGGAASNHRVMDARRRLLSTGEALESLEEMHLFHNSEHNYYPFM